MSREMDALGADVDPVQLLLPGEHAVPEPVAWLVDQLRRRGLWYLLSRNTTAMSCADAATKRWRLGHRGIPLECELKSRVFTTRGPSGEDMIVLGHCHGDRRIDRAGLGRAVGASTEVVDLAAETLTRSTGMAYGSVNPCAMWGRVQAGIPIVQVFDVLLREPLPVPRTMMTNALDHTWALEVAPDQLMAEIPHLVAEISEPDDRFDRLPLPTRAPTIGILTGNAPESGILLWSHVNRHVRTLLGSECLGDVSMPRLVVHSVPEMGLTMELDKRIRAVERAIDLGIQSLCHAGAELLSVACNTSQHFTTLIRDRADLRNARFVSMPEVLASRLAAQAESRVLLLGIRYVVDPYWGTYVTELARWGIEVEVPAEAHRRRLEDIAYRVKEEGPNARVGNMLSQLVARIETEHPPCDSVLLGLTELSMLVPYVKRDLRPRLRDPLDWYGESLARRFLGIDDDPLIAAAEVMR